ncbi:hypothetical protein ACFQMH_25045 [Streptomyces viridiviolaceus]|uniref:Uncharacterized protein n=1 Tax=Streptomyces viridiviolaceus TaxID=68282 RepID=A0ABW2E9M4_9ACTN
MVEAKIASLTTASLEYFEATGAQPAVQRDFAALVERASGRAPQHIREAP